VSDTLITSRPRSARRGGRRRLAALAALALAAGPVAGAAQEPGPGGAPATATAQDGSAATPPAYVGSAICTGCHTEAAEAWAGSHHALAWTLPGPDTVIADFDGTEFAHDGMVARFRIEDGTYYATVTEKDGTTTDYPVHSVAGIAPLQQYLLETEPGRLQSFDVVWDAEAARWYHLYPDQDLPPDDGLHWTGPYKSWDGRCAVCHATGYDANYDPSTDTYAPEVAEIGVGCEACHGPGADHLAWAEATTQTPPPDNYGFSMEFSERQAEIGQCAGCHSRREAHQDDSPLPGTPYHDSYGLSLLRPGLYHADGQILDEVYVTGSFLQSKMYANGVSCGNCHDPHSATLVAEGNAVCTQCHSPAGNPEFPTLAKQLYDDPSHHFHAEGSDGAQCKSCHMIERDYMGVDGRRDHSFRIPRPDLAAQTGGPDACTDCHADQSPNWAAAQIAEWHPDSANRGFHYSQVLARGSRNPVGAAGDLATLAQDPGQPAIVRATAMWLLEQTADARMADRLAPLLEDSDPLVRGGAVALQRVAEPQDRVLRVTGMLGDPVKSVRIAAAKVLLNAPVARLPPAIAADLAVAMGEWQASMASRLDFPETHLQMAGMALTMRDMPAATAAFRQVVTLDPQQTDAWTMLARIAAATGDRAEVQAVVDEALAINPTDPSLLDIQAQLDALE
jgi:predicted CXXCH cytochrome family protein